ncbi:MAG: histidinol-phosphatase HisJ family protein [Ruminococcaceae bacterium]|nr:histidinol-phosphatase HisJ family protein [Oscillospiraceae bacterium]
MTDLHVHTTFSDGKSTPEEVVLSAIGKGMKRLGFSDHSYTAFDERYCMKKERIGEYKRCIAELKEKYIDRIEILCGIEQDLYSAEATDDYDYVIGSVHYILVNGEYIGVDESEETLLCAAERHFGGDLIALTEEYWRTVARVAEETEADVIGHLDLISKFNEGGRLFDESDPRYVAAAKLAVDQLLKADKPFEINTGAISRGYRTTPYPSAFLRQYILENGGAFIYSSDSHAAETLMFAFNR